MAVIRKENEIRSNSRIFVALAAESLAGEEESMDGNRQRGWEPFYR